MEAGCNKLYRVGLVRVELLRERVVYLPRRQLLTPEDLAVTARSLIGRSNREHTVLVCLNIKSTIITVHTLSVGNAFMTCISPREAMRVALLCNATSVALAHNHPSGDPEPSPDDIDQSGFCPPPGNIPTGS